MLGDTFAPFVDAMRIISILLVLLPSLAAAATSSRVPGQLARLAKEYLRRNVGLERAKVRILEREKDSAALRRSKSWSLGMRSSYRDGNLQTLSFLPEPSGSGRHLRHHFSIAKDFRWGGRLSMDKTLSRSFGGEKLHGIVQQVSYRQDLGENFFGRSFAKGVDVSESLRHLAEIDFRKARRRGLLELVRVYTQAEAQKAVVGLQGKAEARARALKKFVRRGVQDGLKSQVELYRAEGNIHLQRERSETARRRLESLLQELSTFLHRAVAREEIAGWPGQRGTPEKFVGAGSLDVAAEQERARMLRHRREENGYQFWPQVSFVVGKKSNGMDLDRSRAYYGGSLFKSPYREYYTGVEVTWPIGNESQRVERSRIEALESVTRAHIGRHQEGFTGYMGHLEKRLSFLGKSIESAKKRKILARKIVQELRGFYRKGKADLERVIRAEEELIETEKNFVRHLAQRDYLFCELAFLYGNTESYITEDK